MESNAVLPTIFLSVFLVGMVGVGVWGMKKTTTLADFFLGGRTLGPWLSAFAYGTTYFSAVVFIGFGGKIGWGYGLNGLWIAIGNTIIGTTLAWLILARRTRRMTQNLDTMTMPEFLQERYDGKLIKMFSALIIFIFLIPYSASVFQGLSYLFEAVFKIPYDYALLIMIGITGIYLIMGGYFAVALTDFIQGIIMLFGALLMIVILTGKAGALMHTDGSLSATLTSLAQQYSQHTVKPPNMLMLAALVFMTSFGVWGMPQMVQKFYAIKNENVIVRAAIVTTVFSIIVTVTAYYTGALTHAFYTPQTIPVDAVGKLNPDKVIPQLLTGNLPSGLMAIILLLVLSASMSTLASLVLVSASSVAIDMVKGHINPNISKTGSLRLMRVLSAIFIVVSYVIARYKFAVIVELMALSWGAVAGTFMAPFFYGLYWKRTTKAGAAAGMIVGLGLSIFLSYWYGKATSPITASISMIVPFIIVPLVSLATKPPKQELIDKAFANV